jgi:hypothetical protein
MSALQEQYAAVNPMGIPAARWGFWSSLLTAIVTVVSFAIAIFTPPRSGPFCLGMCVGYPYTDTAPFFPRDYLWIFPALLLTPLLLIVCACAEILGRSDRMFLGRIALAFAIVCTAIITLDYFIQIEVIQPSLLRNEADGIGLISQYNPHGLFIALEDLGYLMMSAVFFFLGAFLSGQAGLERALRLLLLAGGVLGFVTFIGMSLAFGNGLETRFELAIISINWAVLTATGIMLCILFRRYLRGAAG